MSHPSTLYRFRIELSDVDRSVYEALDFRVAMHPSETPPYLLTRVLAFALNFEPNAESVLEFNPSGLSDHDEPCLSRAAPNGGTQLWIEIGSPSARKLHKASKASNRVRVYAYRDPAAIAKEIAAEKTHRASEIEIYFFPPDFLKGLGMTLAKDNRWTVTVNDGSLMVTAGERTEQTELARATIPQN